MGVFWEHKMKCNYINCNKEIKGNKKYCCELHRYRQKSIDNDKPTGVSFSQEKRANKSSRNLDVKFR
jgi:hypothetical protein